MSPSRVGEMKAQARQMFALWIVGAGMCVPLHAQYVGRVDANKEAKTPPLRATAVLEYTGDYTKPIASRLVPLAVWDGSTYQPGGLYMAQPVPLTVESGTQYELEVSGVPKGLFDVKAAATTGGSWIAIGAYQSLAIAKASKLRASRTPPQVVHDAGFDDDKPHFAHRPEAPPASGSSGSGSGSGSTGSGSGGPGSGSTGKSDAPPPVDPDRPTLHKRTDTGSSSGGNDSSGSAGSSSSGGSTSGSGSGSNSGSSSGAAADPDRPVLHKHSEGNSNDNGAPVSATMDVDPDRPRLRRGRPENLESLDVPSSVEIAKLAGHPEDLKQIVAVSDAKSHETHNFVYSWTDPEDEKKAQSALEDMAKNLLAGRPMTPAITNAPAPAKKATTTVTHKTPTTTTPVRRAARKPAAPALPDLADEQFKAFELTFGGGATLVFSAKSTMPDGKVKFVLMIAQPNFNGTPQVIFKQVTDEATLDVIPRMVVVDAMDTDADNRGELIFALEGKTDRQYAIYRVADRSVEMVFSTAGSS
jgi:hypothetical protein